MSDNPLRILIIDDDEVDRMRLRRFLAESAALQPLKIDEATDGAAGLSALLSHTYDCVLLDYNLPDATGLSILQEILDDDIIMPPVIMQTVLNDEQTGINTVKAGAQDFLVKGCFDSALLTRSIRYARERHRLLQEKALLLDEFRKLATVDELTGVHNRRYFESELGRRVSEGRRHKYPFSLLIADVDGFKAFNDSQGHQHGDAVLRMVAQSLKSRLRTTDLLARYGGDEFAIILIGAELPAAMRVAEDLRQVVESISIAAAVSAPLALTLSIGVAVFPSDGDDKDALVACTDERLYAAKKTGRNRVCGAEMC